MEQTANGDVVVIVGVSKVPGEDGGPAATFLASWSDLQPGNGLSLVYLPAPGDDEVFH